MAQTCGERPGPICGGALPGCTGAGKLPSTGTTDSEGGFGQVPAFIAVLHGTGDEGDDSARRGMTRLSPSETVL